MEIMSAHKQWASRPADERFQSLSALHSAVCARDNSSKDGKVDLTQAHFEVTNGEVILVGGTGQRARFTNWSAGQVMQRMSVPRDLIALLSDPVGAAVLNDRLLPAIKEERLDARQRILLQFNGTNEPYVLRAIHSDRYERIWDKQVTAMLMEHLPPGWHNPLAYAGGRWGADLVPSGLYAGDRDMFAFFVDGGDGDGGSFDVDGDAFNHGFYCWNSEVGAKSLGFASFKFRRVCGNNIIWGATDFSMQRARHVGNAGDVLRGLRKFLTIVSEQGTDQFIKAVRDAKADIILSINARRDKTLDEAFAKFKTKFTQTDITNALDMGTKEALIEKRPVDGSRWFWLQGFTAVARMKQNADERIKLEQDAGALLMPVKR